MPLHRLDSIGQGLPDERPDPRQHLAARVVQVLMCASIWWEGEGGSCCWVTIFVCTVVLDLVIVVSLG